MHETGLVKSLIHEVERIARSYGDPRVLSVRVRMGALCPFSESHLREHFARETKGTAAEYACLIVECGADPIDPAALDAAAQDVTLLSIEVEDALPATMLAASMDAGHEDEGQIGNWGYRPMRWSQG